MSNFAVNASEATIKRGKDLLEKLKQPEDRQGDTLDRIFDIVEHQLDDETLLTNGVDSKALDASLTNIRNAFLSAVSGKSELIAQKDAEIAKVKSIKDDLEKDLRQQIADAKTAQQFAENALKDAQKDALQSEKEASSAKEQLETQRQLLAEKEKTISTLSDQLSDFKEKADQYDALSKENIELKQKLSDMEKEAELQKERSARRQEQALTQANLQIAKLQTQIEMLKKYHIKNSTD